LVAEAVNVVGVPEQMVFDGEAAILTVGVRLGFTIVVMAVELTLAGFAQAAFELSVTAITSPLANDDELYVGLLEPTFTPFIVHW
jgi:hypothetical protein